VAQDCYSEHGMYVSDVAWSGDGIVASTSYDKTVSSMISEFRLHTIVHVSYLRIYLFAFLLPPTPFVPTSRECVTW
jgi:hypothetical protein